MVSYRADGPVVVAVDGSESAAEAVMWAARAAAAHRRPLDVVTVVHVPSFYYSEPYVARGIEEEMRQTAHDRVEAAVALAQRSVDETAAGRLTVTSRILTGKVSAALVEASREASMLVTGTRGLGEFTGLVVGSVAVATAAHAVCPTVVVRGRTMDGAPPTEGPVVVGVDGSEVSVQALRLAFAAASAYDTTLVAVHVWSDATVHPALGSVEDDVHWSSIQAEEEEVLAERLAGFRDEYPDVVVDRVVARDRPVRVLSGYAEAAQLIVVGSRGRGGFSGMLLGSTSQALMQTADCPVMIARSATD